MGEQLRSDQPLLTRPIRPEAVRSHFRENVEIALVDLRREVDFARAHPLFAASMPVDTLEATIPSRVPRRSTPVVLYDGGTELVEQAARQLRTLGYTDIRHLEGDLAAWVRDGGEVYQDVNSPSKAFGELVASRLHTPMIAPEEYVEVTRKAPAVTLDVRTAREFSAGTLDTSASVPGGELVRSVPHLVSVDDLLVVHCAGRTRSILAAQTLINAGCANRVVALENGTIGWRLAGMPLSAGREPQRPLPADAKSSMHDQIRAFAHRANVSAIDDRELHSLLCDHHRTVYRFDVRDPSEYERGHPTEFRSAPGGQLLQETDVYAPVRGAAIVLYSANDARAWATASWLAQMGWSVHVLMDSRLPQTLIDPDGPPSPANPAPTIEPAELEEVLGSQDVALIEVGATSSFLAGHIRGARFSTRRDLASEWDRGPDARTILTSGDGVTAAFAASELSGRSSTQVTSLNGGNQAWTRSGRPLVQHDEASLQVEDDAYRRPYVGLDVTEQTMAAYIAWELGLVAQLQRDATHRFNVIDPATH